jgi:Holliday junction resolvase RusA-like endonuclease
MNAGANAIVVPELRLPPTTAMRFCVPGRSATKGSTIGVWSERSKKVIVKQDSDRLVDWSRDVAWAAKSAGVKCLAHPTAIAVWAWFWLTPPKKDAHLTEAVYVPDVDKCDRALLDALKGIAYQDDRQVVDLVTFKRVHADIEHTDVVLWGVS